MGDSAMQAVFMKLRASGTGFTEEENSIDSSQSHLTIPSKIYPLTPASYQPDVFSWAYELKQIFSLKFFNVLYWPVFVYQQQKFTKLTLFRSCKPLPGFWNLWKTIQKGSFAYNTFFLDITPFHRASNSTHLADITTLALFFGDEFIDGICLTAGKPCIRELVNNNNLNFYLQKRTHGKKVEVIYPFDLIQLLPAHVMNTVNPKYGITYLTFYSVLKSFLELINSYLYELPFERAERVADKIADVCNTCFDSYMHDVSSCPEQDKDADILKLLHFHESKTRHMQKKLLELRCILANKEHVMKSSKLQGWLNVMRVVQIYDDMQDIDGDDGFQDNLLLCTARRYFPQEWQWFSLNKENLIQANQKPWLVSLSMPCSIQYCLQLAREKMKIMNWEQRKIMHYLFFKNWFIAQRDIQILNENGSLLKEQELVMQIYKSISDKMPHLSLEEIKSYAIETCFHSAALRKYVLQNVNISSAYQLRYDLITMCNRSKSAAFDLLVRSSQANC